MAIFQVVDSGSLGLRRRLGSPQVTRMAINPQRTVPSRQFYQCNNGCVHTDAQQVFECNDRR